MESNQDIVDAILFCFPRPIHQPVKWLSIHAHTTIAAYGGAPTLQNYAVLHFSHSEKQQATTN